MAQVQGVFVEELQAAITDSRILVVGAGGIGCELLKNIVLSGFKNIEIIDLDTIDVSNLNRQFLFQKQHVGKAKSHTAREAALRFAPGAQIKAYQDDVMKPEYGINFFKQFRLCLNALDNRKARNHVNRMCLAADIPLVESGTAGYLGQVTVIRKGVTECYECQPKPHQKTFPGCTIRNTPSEPVHCIVWAKHLFNQLFGEVDPDMDVSPDTEDPEAAGEDAAAKAAGEEGEEKGDQAGNVERRSTRAWAQDSGYNTQKLFQKFFNDDIKYLLSMDKLWAKRKPPSPLDWDCLPTDRPAAAQGQAAATDSGLEDQKQWSMAECASKMEEAVKELRDLFTQEVAKKGEEGFLVWDKDDLPALNFVTACANIRMHIFNIPQKTRFEVKSMAGNIIPAIATTNAVIAGCIVMEAFKILQGQEDRCKTVYLTKKPNPRKKVLVTEALVPPNPKCYVCAAKPEVHIKLDLASMTVKGFEERVLKGRLNMVAPDVECGALVLISSEEGETECNNEKTLKEMKLVDGSEIKCDDFLQNYELKAFLWQLKEGETLEGGVEFEVSGDPKDLQPKEEEAKEEVQDTNGANGDHAIEVTADDDDIMEVATANGDNKRRAEEGAGPSGVKRPRTEGDDVEIVDAPAASAEELKRKAKAGGEVVEDGVVCIE